MRNSVRTQHALLLQRLRGSTNTLYNVLQVTMNTYIILHNSPIHLVDSVSYSYQLEKKLLHIQSSKNNTRTCITYIQHSIVYDNQCIKCMLLIAIHHA